MKQEVRNVGKFSASTPSSGSNYLLYSSVESIIYIISISIMRLINSELLRHLILRNIEIRRNDSGELEELSAAQ